MKFSLVLLIGTFLCGKRGISGVSLMKTRGFNNVSSHMNNYRRLATSVDDVETSTPLDLFSSFSARRTHMDTIWNWDMWCQLQYKIGRGNEQVIRHYYDAQLDQCFTFGYNGEDGNENNFSSMVECERHCKGTAYMTLRETSRSSFCGLQPNAGLCLALNDRYFYDVNTGQCKLFIYGGCGGNQNRFLTDEECFRRCIKPDY